MSWLFLFIAGLFEIGFATCMGKARQTDGNTVGWIIGFVICLIISMALVNKALETIPIGTAYAVWTGIGAVGTVLIGIIFFKEPTDFWRMLFLLMLIGGIVGLKLKG